MKKLSGKICVKELVFMPIIIFILTLFFERLQRINNSDYFFISDFFLRRSNYMFDEMKLIFTSVILITLVEMFVSLKVSENYLIARIISILCSLIIFFISYTFISSYNYTVIYILRFIGIYFGQFVFVFIRLNVNFKRANFLSAFLVVFMTLFFSIYQYI